MFVSRTILTDKFSTFLWLDDSGKASWKTDIRLKKHIQQLLEKLGVSQSEVTPLEENKMAYNFLETVRRGVAEKIKIYKNHLSSYLQEACYWASREVYNRLDKGLAGSITIADCFAWGNKGVSQPEKLLKTYRIDGGSSITTYGKKRLATIIREEVNDYLRRKNTASDWGLLKSVSKKKLETVLREAGGFTEERIQEYLLAWQCFKDNYTGVSRHGILQPPNSSQWQLITQQYNLHISQSSQQSLSLNASQIRERLETCVRLIRRYDNPPNISYEQITEYPRGEKDLEKRGERDVVEEFSGFLVEDLDSLEDSQFTRVAEILEGHFESLDKISQGIFYLALGLNLTQTRIVEIIAKIQPEIKQQYQLSRKLKKIKMHLIEAVSKDIKAEAAEDGIDRERIKKIIAILEEWLQEYVESRLVDIAAEVYEELPEAEKGGILNQYLSKLANGGNKPSLYSPVFLEAFRRKLESLFSIGLASEDVEDSLLFLEKFCAFYSSHIVSQ